MKSLKLVFKNSLLLAVVVMFFAQCDTIKGPEPSPTKTGQANVQMTDAPIDDMNVKGAFVTVSEVKIDGETFSGFSGKQTIDLLAYQNGAVKALGLGELEVGTYSNISIVLDYDMDAEGNAPGCYVLTTDEVKHELSNSTSSQTELLLASTFEIKENETTDLVIDFDVRKAIKHEAQNNTNDEYEFVTKGELEASLRTVIETNTGMINGQCEESPTVNEGDKIVVFAYTKGSFDKNVETMGQGESNIFFKNAVTSAVVDANGNYTLAFLEEGDYELHFVSYEDTNNNGKLTLKALLEVDGLLNINANDVSVKANATVNLNVNISGMIII